MAFNRNNWYKFPCGESKFQVVSYDAFNDEYTIRYEKTGNEYNYKSYKLKSIQLVDEGESIMATETLYEVDGKFAKKLAVNSSGLWVMEEKGSGTVFTADKNDCKEVVPYTVEVQFKSYGDTKGYHYTSSEGKFNVGDLLWMPGTDGFNESFARVVAVNTKSRAATKELEPIGRFLLEKV